MSKKNNRALQKKKHLSNIEREKDRIAKMEAKMREVQEREPDPERPEDVDENWEDDDDRADEMDQEPVEGALKNELVTKKIRKNKKFKIFQRRVLIQERKRERKARKSGRVIYTKSMHLETV